jgi:hypothetical protein
VSIELVRDDSRNLPSKSDIRSLIVNAEEAIKKMPGSVVGDNWLNPLKHSFADGCYVREIFNPAHELIVTKIHKKAHPFFLLKGEMSILTEEGVKRIKAPYYGITPAGTKRLIYTHEDVVFVTVHVTNETDLEKIEEEVIAKSFDEIEPTILEAEFIEMVSEQGGR